MKSKLGLFFYRRTIAKRANSGDKIGADKLYCSYIDCGGKLSLEEIIKRYNKANHITITNI